MNNIGQSIKANPIMWGVGAIAIVGVIYLGYDMIRTRKNKTVFPSQSSPAIVKATTIPKVPSEPRGKLPWAIGDVNLWDDEDDSYCRKCSQKCTALDVTEPCRTCRERCPMN